jgi:hypothetical protein
MSPALPRLALLGLLLAVSPAPAQTGGDYHLGWNSMTAGGSTATLGGDYTLAGAVLGRAPGVVANGDYRLAGGFWVGANASTVGAPALDPVPRVFAARIAGPNPSRGATAIAFDLPRAGRGEVTLHTVDGRMVRTLLDAPLGIGRHTVRWDGTDREGRVVPPGLYFARVRVADAQARLHLVRIH